MRKILYVLTLFLLFAFISCNADILINNGEILVPEGEDNENVDVPSEIKLDRPANINATKSFYSDSIVVSWTTVKNADFYTVEKIAHDTEKATGSEQWVEVKETISSNHYIDNSSNLKPNTYYSYRVTAHTNNGIKSDVSKSATGTILASPRDLKASKGTSESEIYLVWDEMPYVDSYVIYKSSSATISGVESEIIATVSAINGATNGYSYAIDKDREAGVELSFAVKAVGETGESASLSLPRVGYARNPNAPASPELVSTTRGESSSKITIKFSSMDSLADTIIVRSAPGAEEKTILDTSLSEADKGKLIIDEQGNYVFDDSTAMSGILYTYAIQSKSDKGLSPATETEAYLLSPVTGVILTPVNEGEKFGYELSFKLPVGADDSNKTTKYSYSIKKTLKNGETSEEVVDETMISSIKTFYPFEKVISLEEERMELSSISISVSNDLGEKTSFVKSKPIDFIPDAIQSITASSNLKPRSGDNANSYGVYPVYIDWTSDSNRNYILFRKGSDGSIVSFKTDNKNFKDETTKSLVMYEYWVDASDALGRTHGEPHAKNAYGGIAPQTYKVMFESLSLKPWLIQDYVPSEYRAWWKNTDVAKKIEYGNAGDLSTQTQALGSASATDHFHGGTVNYNASMESIGAQIYFDYKNFGENPNWYVNGSYEMHVNASGNGSAGTKTNGFTIEGMYPGHVGLNNISVNKKDFSGSYTITIKYSDGDVVSEVNVR